MLCGYILGGCGLPRYNRWAGVNGCDGTAVKSAGVITFCWNCAGTDMCYVC